MQPSKQGQLVELHARVVATGTTSINVEVDLYSEDLLTGERHLGTRGRFVLVAWEAHADPTASRVLTEVRALSIAPGSADPCLCTERNWGRFGAMAYRNPAPTVEYPAAAVPTSRAKLSAALQNRFESLARQLTEGRVQREGSDQAEQVTFADGTIWFPKGYNKDNPAIFVVLVAGVATLAFAALAIPRALNGELYAVPFFLGAVVSGFVTVRQWRIYWRRHEKALADVAMGTLAMPDGLAMIAFDQVIAIPKNRIAHFELVRTGSGTKRLYRLYAIFTDDAGSSSRTFVGFSYRSRIEKREVEHVTKTLEAWLREESRAELQT
ncbi:MAG: hotdog domain-containing protein [Myxococcota bacterium]